MLNRRPVIVGGALMLGGVAAVASLLAVRHAQHNANVKVEGVPVFTIGQTIPLGTTGELAIADHLVREASMPRSLVPATAVTDLDTIRGKVSDGTLASGEILVAGQFVNPSVAPTSADGLGIPTRDVAITISLDPSRAVAGLISPGDKVDLMTIFPLGGGTGDVATATTGYADFFYQDALVIAVGTTTSSATATAASGGAAGSASNLYTLAVPPSGAERITLAAVNGSLYAALVPTGGTAGDIPAVSIGAVDQVVGK